MWSRARAFDEALGQRPARAAAAGSAGDARRRSCTRRRRGGAPVWAAALPLVGTGGPAPKASQESHRLKLTVAYDGTDLAGFQWQAGKVRTVQGDLERAAARVLMPASRVVGASRTDGGAHALGAVAHMDAYGSLGSFADLGATCMYLNGALPPDVKVQSIELAPPGFDAHFSSVGKEYHYLLADGTPRPHDARTRWPVYDRWCFRMRGQPKALSEVRLDVDAMSEAAELLKGVHDYSAFADTKRPSGLGRVKRKRPQLAERGIKPVRTAEKNTRHLWRLAVVREDAPPWPGAGAAGGGGGGGGGVRVEVAGNGFLYRMVRVLVAALVEVGHGRMTPRQARQLLESGDRAKLPVEAAPPSGLYLIRVLYDGDLPEGVAPLPRARTPAGAGGGEGGGEGGGGEAAAEGEDDEEEG